MNKIDLDFFEKVLFYNCLKPDGQFLAVCIDHLDSKLFKNKDIGEVIGIIKDFYSERDSVPTMTEIKARLTTSEMKTHFKDAVTCLKGMDKDYNEVELVKNAEYFFKQKNFRNLMMASAEELSEEKEGDLDVFQKEAERIANISLIDNLGLDFFGENDKVVEYILKKDNYVSTGYKGLDDAFGGGFMREGKAIYNIGGETNIGKSLLLANIAVNLVRNDEHVVIISPEMSEKRYSKRISGILTGIAIASLPDKIENYKEYIKDFIAQHKSKLFIKEVPTRSWSTKQIRPFLRQLKRKKGFTPSLIAIDGHALLIPSVKQPSKHGELQTIVQECRALTYAFDAPALSVGQLNRESHNQSNPGLNATTGSWDSNADFDGITNLWQTDEDREANQIGYAGKKTRDGKKGVSGYLKVDYDTLQMSEAAPETGTDDSQSPDKNITDHIDFDSLTS